MWFAILRGCLSISEKYYMWLKKLNWVETNWDKSKENCTDYFYINW
jgi:hypothetical protein